MAKLNNLFVFNHTKNMILPIGGIFIYSDDNSRARAVRNLIMGIFNMLMGGLMIALGYLVWHNFYPTRVLAFVFGYPMAIFGLIMFIAGIVGLIRRRRIRKQVDRIVEQD